jgi:hypothetical protein
MSLAAALEHAAATLPQLADAIRPANGDPARILEALDPEAGAVLLQWLLSHEPEAGSELVTAFAEDEAGLAPLLALPEAELPKPARKVLRRALHRLRSRGEKIPEAPATPTVATLRPVVDEFAASYVSALDPSGARLVLVLEPNPSGGARLFELVVDERRGVLDCHVYATGRRDARRFVRELAGRKRFSVVEAPEDSVRSLLARIASRPDLEQPLPRSFEEWRSHLATPPAGASPPGELVRRELPEGPLERELLDQAVALVQEGRVGPWPPGREALESCAERVKGAAEGRVIVTGSARRERITAVIGDCADDVFAGPAAAAMADRFREMGYVFWKDSSESEARACLAAARAFEEQPARENPVARAILEGLLSPLLEQLESEEDTSLLATGEPSLVAKP